MEKQNERVLAYELAFVIDQEDLEAVSGGGTVGINWTCYDSLSVSKGPRESLLGSRDCDIDG